MKCTYCRGRGWAWVGTVHNAEREPCEPCGGRGRLFVDWGAIGGAVACLISAVFVCSFIVWSLRGGR